LFAVQFKNWGLPYLPNALAFDPGMENDLFNRIWHLILPGTVLSLIQVAGWSRYLRGSMLEVLRLDYVRTAWAKGLKQRIVILKHAMRNALIPLITVISLAIPGLFGGAIITETIFSYPGMGSLFINALGAYDWPIVMAFLLISTVLIVLANILADVLYAFADPRIRYS
jgi:peptide/nickel transport system permease protein